MQIVAIAILAFGVCAAVMNSGWAAALSFVLFPLQQLLWASSSIFSSTRTLPNFLVGIAVCLSVVRQSLRSTGSFRSVINPVSIGSLALYCWAAVTLLWTPSFQSGSGIVIQGYPYVILMIIIVPITMGRIEVIGDFRRGLMVVGTVTLLAILVSPDFTHWGGRLVHEFSSEDRTNPLAIGELGGLVFMAAVLWKSGSKAGLALAARFFVGAVALVAMLQSGSRGQVIFAVAICLFALPLSRRVANMGRFIAYGVAGIVMVVLVPLIAQLVLQVESLERWNTGDLQEGWRDRVANMLDSLLAWGKAPIAWIVGLGCNAFTSVTNAASEGWIHNLTVELMTEYGLIGLGLFCLVLVITARDVKWLFERFKFDPERRANLGFLVAALGYELFLVQKQGNLWGDIWVFCLMCIVARTRRITERDDLESHSYGEHFSADESAPSEELLHADSGR